MTSYWSVVAMCWVVFWFYWSVNGRRMHAPKRTVSWAFTMPNTILLYVGFVLMLIQRNVLGFLGIRFAPSTDWLQATATMLVMLGVAFAIWSRFVLGANWSATVRINADQRLIRTGPYAFVAHPIYTGISLAAFGTALVGGTLGNALGFASIVASLCSKGLMEERLMRAEFGAPYVDYRRRVKFIIPFVL